MTYQYSKADPVAWEQAMADLRIADAIKTEFEDTDDPIKYEELAVRFDRAKDKVLEQLPPTSMPSSPSSTSSSPKRSGRTSRSTMLTRS